MSEVAKETYSGPAM